MRIVINIALTDLRLFLVNRGNLVGLTIIPIALTFAVGMFAFGGGNSPQLRVDVIDHDGSPLSSQFIASLREANSSLVLCPMDGDDCDLGDATVFDVEWATARVEASTSLAMVAMPAGFGVKVQAFEPVEIVYLSKEDFTAPGFIRQAVETAIQRVNGAAVASHVGANVAEELQALPPEEDSRASFERQVYDRAAAFWDENPVSTTYELTAQAEDDASGATTRGLSQSVPGMGSMYVMFTVLGGMTALVGERKQWTLQRLAAMPISRAQLLGGKILGRFTLGIIQYLVVFAAGVVAGVNLGDDLLALVLVMVAYTLAITALSFALGTRLETEAQANGLSQLLALILAPLGGAWWSLEIVPNFMRAIGHISPVAWAMDGYHALIFENGDLSAVLAPILVLLAITVVCFGIGVRRFRYD